MSDRHILLGVTGSIAAYKAVELVRSMKQEGWSVVVVMTEAATKFVGELTFRTLSQNSVEIGMFDETDAWQPEHISLADKADMMVIAPCTANVIAKVANGIADDLLTSTALSCDVPLIVAPAMNEKMWDNPATQANVDILVSRGITVMDVAEGDLACGVEGKGRLPSIESIMSTVKDRLGESS